MAAKTSSQYSYFIWENGLRETLPTAGTLRIPEFRFDKIEILVNDKNPFASPLAVS